MSTLRPHSTSKDIVPEAVDETIKQGNLLSNLFPDTPRFTIIIAVAFPHTEDDIAADRDCDPDQPEPLISETYVSHVKAINVHTAIEMAMATIASEIDDDPECGEFSMTCAAAFEGHLVDLSLDYDPEQSAFRFDGEGVDTQTS